MKTASPRSKMKNTVVQPKAFLFGVDWKNRNQILSIEDNLDELGVLCRTAGIEVAGQDFQRMDRAHAATLIGSGKVTELKRWIDETQSQMVIFDEELSPRHLRELQELLGEEIHVLDRTALILDIFAQHAHTREGALQVELAQYEYRLPRLTGAWTHLARQAGGSSGRGGTGGVGLRGPGETQLEIDRREISKKIHRLKKELDAVRQHRSRYRMRRKGSGQPVVALVGYTNAGKSTLLNTLAHADIYVADLLFATLDPTTRQVELPGGKAVLITDTVGFIQKLPASLVAAFRATLEEIAEADLLLHIVDISHPNAREHVQSVHQTLHELGLQKIPMVTGINKIDKLKSPPDQSFSSGYPNTVLLSAKTGLGIPDLLQVVENILYQEMNQIKVKIPFREGRLLDLLHREGSVDSVTHKPDGMLVTGRIPGAWLSEFRPYLQGDRSETQ